MPALIRSRPLTERLAAFFNPQDLLLWLAEELHDHVLDEKLQPWSRTIGITCNVVFVVCRAMADTSADAYGQDDIFGDDRRGYKGRGVQWLVCLLYMNLYRADLLLKASLISYALALLAVANAIQTFVRTRKYRLFEARKDDAPSTPSARRVPVTSSPLTASPMRFLASRFLAPDHTDSNDLDQDKDVWEVSVWDPRKLNLDLFTLFSPGHALVYWMLLPANAGNARPSLTILLALTIATLLSAHIGMLISMFVQQATDTRLISKEVMNEYNAKFVHPTINRPVRDVGTQTHESATGPRSRTALVDLYTPTTHIKRSFETNPNPAYTSQLGGGDMGGVPRLPRSATTSALLQTPVHQQAGRRMQTSSQQTAGHTMGSLRFGQSDRPRNDLNSPLKGNGGSLGVYSHAASPLKKAASASHLRPDALHNSAARTGSPLRNLTPGHTNSSASGPGSRSSDLLGDRFDKLRDRRVTGRF